MPHEDACGATSLTSGSRMGRVTANQRPSVIPRLEQTVTALIPAIYEGGVLRPLGPLDLGEHERVYLLLLPDEPAKVAAAQRDALADLIGAGESQQIDVSMRHDEFLYSRPQ